MAFNVEEATIRGMQAAMAAGEITSRQLTAMYLERIAEHDKSGIRLNTVLEINPDALYIAENLDIERAEGKVRGHLHGIPVLLKDNIDTADKMHTSAGSLALANSFAQRDAFLVRRLREEGAVILGKANMTEWANFMTTGMPSGYSSRGGQVLNPYGPGKHTPGGSSSGSASSVAANLCAVAVGTETSGSILHPACYNSIVGIKPTLGLISRTGIIPITYTQDTAGPFGRTVEDAAILLGALAGEDAEDAATRPSRGQAHPDYTKFLDRKGLKGARIGINRGYQGDFTKEEKELVDRAVEVLRQCGAEIVEDTNLHHVADHSSVLLNEFKSALNRYFAFLGPHAPVKSLRDVIDFNNRNQEKALKFGQTWMLRAEYETSGTMTEPEYIRDRLKDWRMSREEGIDKLMEKHKLDALFCPGVTDSPAVSGYPAVMVPAGYREDGLPFGVSFAGKPYSEPALLRFAYAFEQAYPVRVPPNLS
ncbi:amidase [Cohnella candidum]|uniref:Amidase n=1 Tax=Cohnella candidum TaxID=2674991 RepID=A0A3G3K652_9BACL|nr:amidase [Cohnella candidum]AYQ75249.1 amidase [Cohnella candidum]